jgi:hypothetical protein
MKKLIVSILAILYIGTSTGATLNLHYCMGKLADWGLGHSSSKTCGKCGMEKSNVKKSGCCSDEEKFIKNTEDQKTAESGFQSLGLVSVGLPVSYIEFYLYKFPSVTEENPRSHAPPRSNSVAVYIRDCVFLI